MLESLNNALLSGNPDFDQLFPSLARVKKQPYIFEIDFGLKELPTEPGILMLRGARQYGKTTWLEQQLVKTIKVFGVGTAFYLNGDRIPSHQVLEQEIEKLLLLLQASSSVKRIFIDEITAIEKFESALKRLADREKLRDILLITTGSKATDLRRGAERLPGRKGKLARTNYLFTPISYKEFYRLCHKDLGNKTLLTYLISGGSPIACLELASSGSIPEYVMELTRDWIEGEITSSGRNRQSLINIMQVLFRMGGASIGQAKLAREAGLANNTVAAGYIELLNDLGCVIPEYSWDESRKIMVLRKPCKYPFTNLLAAVAYSFDGIYTVEKFLNLSPVAQGVWYEWLVAQELTRRDALRYNKLLQPLKFWQSASHEIDFVTENEWVEVKRGTVNLSDFLWFHRQFPNKKLTVICNNKFTSDFISSCTLEEFLLRDEV